jgi:hypothetical protein
MKRMGLMCAIVLSLAQRAGAQSLEERLSDLFRFGSCGQILCLATGSNHGDHFVPASVVGNAALVSFLSNSIGASASNLPISATTSGVTYTIVRGVPVQSTTSSGPIFGERAQTLGKGRLMVGGNVNVLKFTKLRGIGMDSLLFTFTHSDQPPTGLGNPPFENDIIAVRANLNISMVIASFVLTYGLSDRVDMGVAIPVVNASLSGRSQAQIVTNVSPAVHFFGGTSSNPILSAITSTSGSSIGVGDIALRVKARLLGGADKAAVALLGDVRLGNGSIEDLQGSGGSTVRVSGIASAVFGDFSPHLNAGYALRTGSLQTNAILATAGFDHALTERATFAADVLSEIQVGENKVDVPAPVVVNGTPILLTNIPNKRGDIVNLSLGAKISSARGLTTVVNVLVPLLNGALRPNAVLTAGLEYAY